MRSYTVFVLLLISSGVFVVVQATSTPTPHVLNSPTPTTDPDTVNAADARKAGADAQAKSAGKATAAKKQAKKSKAKASSKKRDAPIAKPRMKRPLRVIGQGWETIAPAVVANEGVAPTARGIFAKDGLRLALTATKGREGIEAALARGGEDKKGADVALLPLSSFVAAYERLRALSPKILFVVGWSRGRHALLAKPKASLRSRQSYVIGKRGQPEVYLALSLLDLAGVDPRRVRVLSTADKLAKRASFRAVRLPLQTDITSRGQRVLLSTADATHLVPIVAVASNGFIDKHHDTLLVWARGWLAGVERLNENVPAAARKIAKMQGAPDALALLKRLGQIQSASLIDNARLAGLSGREPVTLDRLFRHCWRLWRATGLLASPMPEKAPLSVFTMAALARTHPSLVDAPAAKKRGRQPQGEFKQLFAYEPKMRRWNQREAIDAIGFVAGLFHRAQLRVSVRGSTSKSKRIVDAVVTRFALTRPERITAASRNSGRLLRIEVHTIQ